MVEDVNFPLDQARNTSTFQFLLKSDRPRRIEDKEAKQNIVEAERRELQASREVVDSDRIEAFEDVTRIDLGSLESRVELFQGARPQAGEDLRNPTELKNQEAKQDVAEAERRELQASGGVANPDRVEEFEDVTRIDLGSLESRVELFQGARPQAGENLRNPTDASALETERGQNISSLI
jgi:hypothetical protein